MKHTAGPGAAPAAELKVLRELARGNGLQLAAVGLLALVSTGATLALPLVVGKLLGAIQSGEGLTVWAAVMVAAGFGSAAAGALASFLLGRMGQRLICRLRVRTMRHSLGLRLADARREGSGNLVARLTSDAARIKNLIDIGPVQLPMAGITVLGTLVVMGLLDWVLLLITVGAFLAAVGIITLVVKGLRRKYAAVGEEVGTLAQSFVAALDSLTVIKAYRAEDTVSANLAERARKVAKLETDAARMESLMVPVINLGQQIALVAVVVGGGARMLDGHLLLADFVAFLLYLLQLTAPLIMAASGVSGIQLGLVARKRFEDVFALPAEEGTYSPDVATAAPRSASVQKRAVASAEVPAVRFEDVVFGYEAERPVLRGARFTVPGRGLTAVVGLSGSGKTTVLSLIERFMEPDSGRIEVHGRDLSDWSPADLRSRIAYVDQASTLLQESVRANLVLGRRRPADDTTLYSVLDRVGLAEDIRALPDGLDTVLDGATGLSGGQRQRLALARAVLADADLVLLDEPTSHLDSVNEQRLRLAVDRLAAERAVVVVAHRISTIQHADHVIVMDRGAVTDEGGHAALVDRCPAYAELVAGQSLGADFRAPVAA
ncbi:ABC transporter ATP-binding protein [Streptomyces pristinaespiralis]|uniref:ABC transporter ATP-binding protein n=2 Tax=Streptomyces pristinaespiralis TaxID=38300 RepID=B5H658_STRE2|nr:ABC transporter ATP-binding protein [Streptomyces pristinaespiralis]ALC22068.1 ABC transporter ATP-binding protein [Streptomyces pristinaespiralis]EDY62319.1 ABC transporter ATP-binding protein [Streptomyces pristinaespiralis ATCC 25486]QMU15284.1 ABC transporter ATP-binding protein [Streptomyces pristinaespiralis]